MQNLEDIKEIIIENKSRLLQEYGLQIIGIFGSYARNEATVQSDLDLLVEFNNPKGFQTLKAWDFLEKLTNVKIDLVSSKYLKPQFRKFIEEEIIYV